MLENWVLVVVVVLLLRLLTRKTSGWGRCNLSRHTAADMLLLLLPLVAAALVMLQAAKACACRQWRKFTAAPTPWLY